MNQGWKATMRACVAACVGGLMLTACGGGGGGGDDAEARARSQGICTTAAQIGQVQPFMRDWYYFADEVAPQNPAAHGSLHSFFEASLYRPDKDSIDPDSPADRWSYLTTTSEYLNYFGEGMQLDYGLLTTGPKERSDGLMIQSVDPAGAAARAGLGRGDVITRVNGQSVAGWMSDDGMRSVFGALYYPQEGQRIWLEVLNGGRTRVVDMAAVSYRMTLVPKTDLIRSPSGKPAGYIRLDGFVNLAWDALWQALWRFSPQGDLPADALVLDLRYNGGGSLDLAAGLVNHIVGAGHEGEVMAWVEYNARRPRQAGDDAYRFEPSALPGWKTVYVLSGSGSCSASEFVINALKPYVKVVQVGGTTCGKPVGFEPWEMDGACAGTVVSAVTFELLNKDRNGGYYAGLAPNCPVPDDYGRQPGDTAEALTAMALHHLDQGACPVVSPMPTRPAMLAAPKFNMMAPAGRLPRGNMWRQ